MVLPPRVGRKLALTVAVATAATAGSATAATKHGITPLAPKPGTSVPAGRSPVFRVRVKGPGQVWIHVCKSKHTDRWGVICARESIGRAKKKRHSTFEFKPTFYDYPEFWLNEPRTYYWQAFRIYCNSQDCEQEGPVVRFKVA
jgi:hypothetical protein